jgi:hypothetical protein
MIGNYDDDDDDDVDECGAKGGKKIKNGNRSTRRKPAQVLLCPPQIPQDLIGNCISKLYLNEEFSKIIVIIIIIIIIIIIM